MEKQQVIQLNKAYDKRLKALNKNFFKTKEIGLNVFIEYLKYLRDCLVIEITKDLTEHEPTKIKIATLTTAIAEFEAYKSCQDDTKKAFHWNNFCELFKLNMEEWLKPNDSV